MTKKTERIVVVILLIVGGVLIGSGIGQTISEIIDNSVAGPSTIGLGCGFIAAVVYMLRWKD
ncbi:MAG: hypothetical protein HOK29_00005 [Candidatus Marinimicrobia bacterium]|nr:hypothetical protein [Candidatus Neomarinimicrobiota bacterium]